MQTVQQNAYDLDPYAKEFGIKISEKLASVEARILPAPWVMCFSFSCYDYISEKDSWYYINCTIMALLTAVEVSRNWKRKGLFATSWSVEHDEQGILLVHWAHFLKILLFILSEATGRL